MWTGNRKTGRSVVHSTNGIVAASHPLAAQTGVSILQKGGNAIDAAIATAATLNIVEPMMTGIGGDAFVLLTLGGKANQIHALNASGRSGSNMTLEAVSKVVEDDSIPRQGGAPTTVPGALDGWCQLLEKYGTMELKDVLHPAIEFAEKGLPVYESIAFYWNNATTKLSATEEAKLNYLIDGKAPETGTIFKQPHLAKTFDLIAQNGPEVFYTGEIANKIVKIVQKYGGFLTKDDLESGLGSSTWEKPISTQYKDYTIFECPPNGQGIAALIGLNILENFDLKEWGSFQHLHSQMESVKLSYADLHQYNADPSCVRVPISELLSKDYAKERSRLISLTKSLKDPSPGKVSYGEDTTYFAVVDKEFNGVSFINSLYYGFGSGIVAGDTGIALQNRGALFSLDPEHLNVVAPRKRPFHTIIPAMIAKENQVNLVFGIMGGEHQAQAHLQVVSNIIDFELNVQEAVEAPRFNYFFDSRYPDISGTISLEIGFPNNTILQLMRIGQQIKWIPIRHFGGGQLIQINHKTQVLSGGSDPRKDGCAIGY